MKRRNAILFRRGKLLTLFLFISVLSKGQTQTFTTDDTYTVPANITTILVQCWGAGGGGSTITNSSRAGGGGGGGAFASSTFTVTPGAIYNVSVGQGGAASANGENTTFGTTIVVAQGGRGGTANATTAGAGGSIASSTGDVRYSGGNGANGVSTVASGGGGGAAGNTGAGGPASGAIGGTGTAQNGGNGANGVSGGSNGGNGSIYGGGGSGASTNSSTDRTGGSGANGLVVVTACNTASMGYGFERNITIDRTKVAGGNDLNSFPVLINLAGQNYLMSSPTGQILNSNGYDIIFTDGNYNKLDHQLEYYSGTNGDLIAWVRIPVLSVSANTVIKILYGNPQISSDLSVTTVWDSHYKGVWHFDNNSLGDFTTYNNPGTSYSSPTYPAGRIYNSMGLNGSSQYAEVLNAPEINFAGNITVSAWVYMGLGGRDQKIASNQNNSSGGYKFGVYTNNKVEFEIRNSANAPSLNRDVNGGTILNTGQWYYLAGISSDVLDSIKTVVNGNQERPFKKNGILGTAADKLTISKEPFENNYYFNGRFDELRISNVVRSNGWLRTEYNNQNSPSNFYSVDGGAPSNNLPSASICNGPITLTFGYPAGGTYSGAPNIVGNVFTPPSAGTYTLVYTYNGSCGPVVVTKNFIITDIPPAPIAPNKEYCINQIAYLEATSGQNIRWYSGGVLVSTANPFSTGQTLPGTYNYTVRQSVNDCESPPTAVTLTISGGAPAVPVANAGSAAACSQITANWTASANAASYRLDVSTVNTFASYVAGYQDRNVLNVTTFNVTGLTAGTTYYYRVRAVNGCGTSVSSSTITYATSPAAPATPGAISGTTPQCPALTNQTYSITAVPNATTYTWTVPAGWSVTSGAGTNSINVTTGAAGQNGNITVTAGNSCGTSAAASRAVTVNPGTPATPGAISGTTPQCPALTNQTYSITAVPNATTYTWTVPAGWSVTSGAGTNSINVTTGAAGQNGNITVTAGNSCGTSAAASRAVTVNPGTPATPGAISGTTPQCPALTNQTYSITAVPNATTYTWTVPAGWSVTSGAGTNSINVTTGAAGQNGNITVTAGNSCGTSAAASRAVTVNPNVSTPVFTLGATSTRCFGAGTETYTATAANSTGITYSLDASSIAGGNSIAAGTGTVTYVAGWSGTSIITASAAGCNGPAIANHTATTSGSIVWTGSVNTDWYTAGNWSCGIIPDLTTPIQIQNVVNKPILSTGPAGSAKNILIDNGSSLTIVGNTIQISGTITNNGTFDVTNGTVEMNGSAAQVIGPGSFAGNIIRNLTINNSAGVSLSGPLNVTGIVLISSGSLSSAGNLTLVSTATGTALIDGSGAGTVTGNVTMQRYLPSVFGYRYFSSPFQAATVNQFADDMALGPFTFFRYDENRTSSGWVDYDAPSTNPLVPIQGYAINFGDVTATGTVDITGAVNDGNLSVTLSNHNYTYTKGFNLVGNPYPSPINWNAPGWTKTNIDNAIYCFNASTTDQYGGTYNSYVNGISSNGIVDNIIPSMQGFLVHVSNGAYPVTGTLGLNNSIRITNLNHAFAKSVVAYPVPMLRLKTGFDDDPASTDPAIIYFDEKATGDFDSELDALKLLNTDFSVANLYTISPDGSKLSISALPPLSTEILQIPLGVKLNREGSVYFRISEIDETLSGLRIFISDIVTGINQDLLPDKEYRLSLGTGEYNNRFFLNFSNIATGSEEITVNEDLFRIWSSNGKVKADINILEGKGVLKFYNLMGQVLYITTVYQKGYHEFDPGLKEGIYIVKYTSGSRLITRKIHIQN